MTTAVELLEAGKNRLIEEGWTQGEFVRADNTRCAIGALRNSQPFGREEAHNSLDDEYNTAYEALALSVPQEGWDVIDFNDDDATEFPDVLDLYDRAIIKAKELEAKGVL